MDDQVTYVRQLQEDDGQVILINQFNRRPATPGVSLRRGRTMPRS